MPAPAPQSDTMWSTRPLTSTEITAMLRSILGVFDDPKLSSHSLKTTCLSWCAKADVSREHRRILEGTPVPWLTQTASIPVTCRSSPWRRSAICEGRFNPDAPRSQYWPTAMCVVPQGQQTFQGPGVVPMTPKVNIQFQ